MKNLKKTKNLKKWKIKTIKKRKKKLIKSKIKYQTGGTFVLTICEPNNCNIILNSNKLNNNNIFTIEYEGCIRHFPIKDDELDFQFLYLDYSNNLSGVLIKRNNNLKNEYVENIATFIRNNQPIYSKKEFLKQNKIKRLLWLSRLCENEINISDTNPKIEELNNLLKEKCNNLSISLDYMYNMNGNVVSYNNKFINQLILCLNNPIEGCISSIEIKIDDDDLIIKSKTKKEFEGKKYNKLLRAVVIIIAPFLNCNSLISDAINPISAWLLMNSFNATTTDKLMINFLRNKNILESGNPTVVTKDMINWELINEFYAINKYNELILKIDLTNPENITKAYDVFINLINKENLEKEIICP